jgi:hypothetical protein
MLLYLFFLSLTSNSVHLVPSSYGNEKQASLPFRPKKY